MKRKTEERQISFEPGSFLQQEESGLNEGPGSLESSSTMESSSFTGNSLSKQTTHRLLWTGLFLSAMTIGYNVIEGLVSLFFGSQDETLALMGFGVDSFVEVLSALGVLHLLMRMRKNGAEATSRVSWERNALRITGVAFYFLVVGLIIASILQIYLQRPPESTVSGMIITGISMAGMGFLIYGKIKVGRSLNSPAILADANCSKSCLYLSAAVFASGLLYTLTGLLYADTAGALAVAIFAFREGRESLQKAGQEDIGCGCSDHCS